MGSSTFSPLRCCPSFSFVCSATTNKELAGTLFCARSDTRRASQALIHNSWSLWTALDRPTSVCKETLAIPAYSHHERPLAPVVASCPRNPQHPATPKPQNSSSRFLVIQPWPLLPPATPC